MKKSSTQRRVAYGFIFAFLCLAFFTIVTYNNLLKTTNESRENNVTLAVLKSAENTFNDIQDFESGYRHYLMTRDKDFLEQYNRERRSYQMHFAELRSADVTDAEETAYIGELNSLVQKKFKSEKNKLDVFEKGEQKFHQAEILSVSERAFMDSVRKYTSLIEDKERVNLAAYDKQKKENAANTLHLFVAFSAIALLSFFIFYIIINRNTKRNEKSEELLKKLNEEIAAQKLAESQNLLRTIFETKPECIKLLGAGCELLEMNPSGLAMIEADSLGQVIGQSVLGLVNEMHREAFIRLTSDVFAGKSGTLEFEITGLKGSHRWLETQAVPLKDVTGKIISLLGVTRDITEQKKADQQKEFDANNLYALINNTSDQLWSVDRNFKLITSNQAFDEMIKFITGTSVTKGSDVLAEGFSDEQLLRWKKFYERAFSGETFTEIIFSDTPVEFWTETSFYPIIKGNVVIGTACFSHNITERKKSEETILISEAKYRSVVENMHESLVVEDSEGRLVYANNEFTKIFGFTQDEFKNLSLTDYTSAASYNEVIERHRNRMKGLPVAEEFEYRGKRKDGTEIWIEARVSSILENGKLIGTQSLERDITERKKSEEELVKSEEKFRALIEHSYDAISLVDKNGTIIYRSPATERITGFTLEETIGKNMYDSIHPDDLDETREFYRKLMNEPNVPKLKTHRLLHKDGHYILVEGTVTNLLENESVKAIVSNFHDITEKKKSEEELQKSELRYRSLIEQASDAIMITDFTGKFIDVNESLCKMFGYAKEELLHMSASDLIDSEDLRKRPLQFGLLSTGQHVFNERPMIHKNGTVIDVEANVKKIGEDHVLAIARDITERKKVQKELERSHEQLRQLSSHLETVREDERTNIAREIHDELGQQLTGLRMDISWLNRKIPSENKTVHNKITDMLSLIDQTMKTVRHISSELRPSILDDLGLIDALDWQSNEFEKRTGVHCTFASTSREIDFEKNLSTGIFRVFQETLTNVARHARASEIITSLELDDDNIVLKVKDNGKGFDETEVKNKNTLGLVGMKERAMMFGGRITIESSKGKGTSVILQVPLKISQGKTS